MKPCARCGEITDDLCPWCSRPCCMNCLCACGSGRDFGRDTRAAAIAVVGYGAEPGPEYSELELQLFHAVLSLLPLAPVIERAEVEV